MSNRNYVNRFCFVVDNKLDIENLSLNLKPVSTQAENVQIALYKHERTYFIMMEYVSEISNNTIKKKLHKTISKILNINEISINEIANLIFKKEPDSKDFFKGGISCKRTVMTLEIKNNETLLKEYKEIHRPENIWPQIIDNMDTMAIKNMEIYMTGFKAFLVMDTADDFDLEKDGKIWAELPKEREWQEYVSKYQKVTPGSNVSEKWKLMEYIQNS